MRFRLARSSNLRPESVDLPQRPRHLSRCSQKSHAPQQPADKRPIQPLQLLPTSSPVLFFFLNEPPTPEISPLPLHAALPTPAPIGAEPSGRRMQTDDKVLITHQDVPRTRLRVTVEKRKGEDA